MKSIKFENNKLFFLDQTQLPLKEKWCQCKNLDDGFLAIKKLKVRGAPLIGVFAGYCLAVCLKKMSNKRQVFLKEVKRTINKLKRCRPTAVNLAWALERIETVIEKEKKSSVLNIKEAIIKEAKNIHKQDILLCKKMADFGVKLVKSDDAILTHCNTGFLATSGEGTALSVIFKANKIYKNIKVYADETRPLLQGSRLTAWELTKKKVNFSVICDNMAASLMQAKKIDKIFVGADRVALNGDAANKIGTYSLAVLARYHKIPFYIVAPFSTFDLNLTTGRDIPIEQRKDDEVRKVLNKLYIAPKKARCYNPAFDVTPNKLITAIVTDKGIIFPPYKKNIKKVIG